MSNNIRIEPARIDDLNEILLLQKEAFRTEAEWHGNYDIEPLKQTYDSILSDFTTYIFLKATDGDKIIGSVKYRVLDDRVWLGKLIVHTGYRRQGLGKRLLREVEKANPFANKFQLFTAASSIHNIGLYESLGYKVCNTYLDENQANLMMVEMIKINDHE